MGSSGSGNFTDYSGVPNSGNRGGVTAEDNCGKAFSAMLEEVDRCAYYLNHGTLPPVGEPITIERRVRIAAISAKNEIIGYLPTAYNYLAQCLADGLRYSGNVRSTRTTPILSVTIDAAPQP